MLSENEGFPPQADQGSGFSNKKFQITKNIHKNNGAKRHPQIFNFQFPDKAGFTLRYNRLVRLVDLNKEKDNGNS